MVRQMKKALYIALGHFCMAIAVIGFITPLLPWVPFVLLASGCYARGSQQFLKKLLRNKISGPLIRDWKRYGAIPVRAKVIAIVMIVLSMSWSMYVVPLPLVRLLLVAIGVCVSAYILSRPSVEPEEKEGSS